MTTVANKASVIFIREVDEQMTGSNCCGKLEGENARLEGESAFPERRTVMEQMGELYRDARKRYDGSVDVDMVDPRNQIYLVMRLIGDSFRYGVPIKDAMKAVFSHSIPSIIINGRLAFSKELPTADVFHRKVAAITADEGGR